jgi:hypothetical protein
MSRQSEFIDHAPDCERLMNLASDPIMKETSSSDMWIALANESSTMPADDITKKIADLEKLQQDLSQ